MEINFFFFLLQIILQIKSVFLIVYVRVLKFSWNQIYIRLFVDSILIILKMILLITTTCVRYNYLLIVFQTLEYTFVMMCKNTVTGE